MVTKIWIIIHKNICSNTIYILQNVFFSFILQMRVNTNVVITVVDPIGRKSGMTQEVQVFITKSQL